MQSSVPHGIVVDLSAGYERRLAADRGTTLPCCVGLLERTPVNQTYLSVITLMEIRAGVERLRPESDKRAVLERWLTYKIPKQFPQRILPATAEIADAAGRLLAAEKKDARTPAITDLLLAATAKVYGMTVVTMNRKHFETLHVPLVSF